MLQDDYIYCPRCKNTLIIKKIDNEEVKECPNCGFIYWNKPKPVVSIIVHRNNNVLMLQRANEPFKDYWVLPGGFMRYEDTPQEAILRELKEETGLKAKIEGVIGAYRIDNDSRGIHIDIIYHGTSRNSPQISKEHTDWRYFSKEELPNNIAYKHREAIMDWYNTNND